MDTIDVLDDALDAPDRRKQDEGDDDVELDGLEEDMAGDY